ncbi:MAG TPA: pseudouridine synthase [Candidatus Xenobia bacterium]|jgi:tRNA pseudouridine65 synthase
MLLYQDDDLVVVNKPSGLLVHRGWARDPVVLMTMVRDQLGQWVYPVHRIDRGASGAVLMALRPEIAATLAKGFEQGTVGKTYLALVRGITPDDGVIDHPVPRDDGVRVEAVTRYRRIDTFERYSFVEVQPQQGRLHQIRRHMKHISHPLIGDVRYGKGEHNRRFREEFDMHRLALHAWQLGFDHPNGTRLTITAPLPEDLAGPFCRMGLHLPPG